MATMVTVTGMRMAARTHDPARRAAATTVDPALDRDRSATTAARVSFTVAVLLPNI